MSTETILANLTNLTRMHKSLLELAYTKTEIIKVGDMERLDQLLKDEQTHVAAISQLELQRQAVVTDYLRENGISPAETPTVATVIEAATNADDQVALTKARNDLLLVVDQLRYQNELNQKLTFQSLQFINLTMDLLKPKPDQINYSRPDKTAEPAKSKTYFDSQA
ncbi:flagellar protein FlgN [Paenisporosarcina cavernae]|uniref:Flagellar protein FlgN n=1 Tax=Paenisporosarcina cavernae TaxID=2320858 RepID=A0A385YRB3_9BACL|nr:flagellar protein FlgN [Paenisporosarcina cavernae]AYC28940.1 flagellar protein FlgN [Paenisporosarcina cavernae]